MVGDVAQYKVLGFCWCVISGNFVYMLGCISVLLIFKY